MKPVDLRRVNDGQAWNGSIHGNRKPPGLPDNECGQAYSLLWIVKSLDCEIEGEYSVGRIQRVGFRLHPPRVPFVPDCPTTPRTRPDLAIRTPNLLNIRTER